MKSIKMEIGRYYTMDSSGWKFIFKLKRINEYAEAASDAYLEVYKKDGDSYYYDGREYRLFTIKGSSIRECTDEELLWIKACENEGKHVPLEVAKEFTFNYEIF